MLSISKPIIVEGKYDKIKLSSIVRANIITTDGFGIFPTPKRRSFFADLPKKEASSR